MRGLGGVGGFPSRHGEKSDWTPDGCRRVNLGTSDTGWVVKGPR